MTQIAASLTLLLLFGRPATATDLTVFAAASLTDAMKEIGANYEKVSGDKVAFNFAASNLLGRQIEEGAPADLFLSADEASMDKLDRKHRLVPGSRRSLLSNTLVVVVPSDSTLAITRATDLAGPQVRVLALAEPQTVPAGIYAKSYLRSQKLWNKVIDRVVPTENVRACLQAVAGGNADAGIVYKTDAAISKKVKVAFEVPAGEGPRISYPAAAIAGSPQPAAAKKLLDYLAGPQGQEVFRRHGFHILPAR
jgi:molybdate transport system substrate-binding protein